MEYKVRLFLGEDLIDPNDYDKVVISSANVDRIVNHIYELSHAGEEKTDLPAGQ